MNKKSIFAILLISVLLVVSCSTRIYEPHGEYCPNCGQEDDDRYCEHCGFDRLWGTTISAEDVKVLMTKTPEEIAAAIKTAGDARLYWQESEMAATDPEYTPEYKNGWMYERTGYEELVTNSYCSSGGLANYVSYVLAGDYESVGQIKWIGFKSGVFNYVELDDDYYPFDLGSDLYNYYQKPFDTLKEFGKKDVSFAYLTEYFKVTGIDAKASNTYVIYVQETTAKKPNGTPFIIDGRKIYVPESEMESLKTIYWRYGGNPFEAKDFDIGVAGYNIKFKGAINPYPGKVTKGHPLSE